MLMSELGDIIGGTSGAEAYAHAVSSAQAGGPREEFDYFDIGGYYFNFFSHSFFFFFHCC